MDMQKIQHFFAVIEHQNLSSAARSLRVSQPTLSRQMQALENEFETALFVRGARGMTLTEAGQRLHEGLQGLERHLRSLKNDVAAALVEPSGTIAFGIPPSPRSLIALPLLQRFAKAYPRVVVRVVEETSGQLRDLIASGVLDVAITNAHEPSHGVMSQPLGREKMLLVGSAEAGLSMKKATPIARLAELPLILTTRPNSLRLIVEAGLSAQGLHPNIRIEANTLPLMTDLVCAGLGYTVLPACGVTGLLKERALSASPIEGVFVTWLVAKPKTRSLSVAAELFYQAVCNIGQEQIDANVWLAHN